MKSLQKTSYCLLLALTVACGAVDARELKLSCNWDTQVQWGFVNYTFLLGDGNTPPTAENSLRIVVTPNRDGSTDVYIHEHYVFSVKFSRDYLHFKTVFFQNHTDEVFLDKWSHQVEEDSILYSHRINRETLMKKTDDYPAIIEGDIVFLDGDTGQCQMGHQSIPEPKPAKPKPARFSDPLPNQKF